MRQFVSSKAPDSKGLLEITGKDFHYLRKVLRLSVGDMASVSIPGGALLQTTVCSVDDARKKITLQICQNCSGAFGGLSTEESAKVSRPRSVLALLQFIPKPQKMELIVRQATECGVSFVIPVVGQYSQGGCQKALLSGGRFERIIREARQQSGSQVETKILEPQKLPCALDLLESADFWQGQDFLSAQETSDNFAFAKIVLYERTERTCPLSAALFGLEGGCRQEQDCAQGQGQTGVLGQDAAGSLALSKNAKKPAACVYAVGSEGGISPEEYELLLSRGFKAVHFNTNILRCETAALYAAAAIQSALDN